MNELRKLVFEKIKFEKLKISKNDYAVLVEKGAEQGIEETQIKKMVFSCLKELKSFKGNTLPLSILDERNVELEAEELYIPAEILKAWKEETIVKLNELEKILALNDSNELQTFLSQNPEMESASKVPLSQFVKSLHKDVDSSRQSAEQRTEPEVEAKAESKTESKTESKAEPEAEPNSSETSSEESVEKAAESEIANSEQDSGEENKTEAQVADAQLLKKKKKQRIAIVFGAILLLNFFWAIFFHSDKDPLSAYYQEKFQYAEIVDSRDNQKYRTILIGSQIWIVQNMNYAVEGSICDSCDVYGRLYSHSTAEKACPAGFVLPTFADYKALQNLSDKNQDWRSAFGWEFGNDRFGFAAIPSGFFSRKDFLVKRRGEMAGYWIAESRGAFALRLKIDQKENLNVDALEDDYGFSVRCIQEETSIREGYAGYYFTETGKFRDFGQSEFVDSRDGKTYTSVNIDGVIWMAENLKYDTENSYCYEDDFGNCQYFGRLYTWESALNACPDGYHLPTVDEWNALLRAVGGEEIAGDALKSSSGWHDNYTGSGSNAYGFKALPAGVRNSDGEYFDINDYASFWSVSDAGISNAYYLSISYEDALAELDKSNKHYAQSVRCVKNP